MPIARSVRLPLAASLAGAIVAIVLASCGPGQGSGTTQTPAPGEGDANRVNGLTPEQARQTLAKVGGTTITVGQVAEELASKGAFLRSRYNSPERRREFVDQMVRFELLAQEAERRGYDRLPEVQRSRKQMMIRRFLEQRFEQAGPEAIEVADVRAYYEANPREFHTPEQVRASHILIRDRATAQRVLREILAAPNDLGLYRRLAEEHNQDEATRDRFGDLGFFSRPTERVEGEAPLPDALATAAFTIDRLGGVHREIVQSPAGFHIVKLTGRRAAMNRTFEQAERVIRNRLWRERREGAIEALIAELRAEADVQENLELLSEVHIEAAAEAEDAPAAPRVSSQQATPQHGPEREAPPRAPAPREERTP